MTAPFQEQPGGGWAEYQRLVLSELERLNDNMEERDKVTQKMQVDIAMLQVKAGVWGLIGGVIPVIVLIVVHLITRG